MSNDELAQQVLSAPVSPNARLATATVVQVSPDVARVEFVRSGKKVTGSIPAPESLSSVSLAVGDIVTALVCDDSDSPVLSLSRSEVVAALMSSVSPEIRSGRVVVKGVARIPGVRTKVAVAATEKGVDPVAACVGREHNRVDFLRARLFGERVDIIAWHPDTEQLLRNALLPAGVSSVKMEPGPPDKKPTATVTVPNFQLPAAVGAHGSNSLLAGRLAGVWVRVDAE